MNPRDLPSIHSLLEHADIIPYVAAHGREFIKTLCQQATESLRKHAGTETPDSTQILEQIVKYIDHNISPSLQRLINATGTVLHTNLGRAPLPEQALLSISDTSRSYTNLEFNLESGLRGHRSDHIGRILPILTGAEAGFAVNNNAGAVLLALAAIAKGREVIVSRGELIEIGGGFRIPDVMAESGAELREVGTTNRTHLKDYEDAINERTGLLFKAHWSNFTMNGFTCSVDLQSLVSLGKRYSIPVMYDLGSGCLLDGTPFGWHTTTVPECIRTGVDIVSFSGDKLLGGPQAGILCGRSDLIARTASHPLARALRIDKLSLSALEATLRIYRDPDRAWKEIPVLRILSQTEPEIRTRVRRWLKRCGVMPSSCSIRPLRDLAVIGGGALPGVMLPTWGIALKSDRISAQTLLNRLRSAPVPIVARIKDDEVFLDFRTVSHQEEDEIRNTLAAITDG